MLPGFFIWDRLRLKITITSITTQDEHKRPDAWRCGNPVPPPLVDRDRSFCFREHLTRLNVFGG